MGGHNGTRYLKSTERLKLHSDSWVSGTGLPEAVGRTAAVASNSEEIIGYLVGGIGGKSKVWYLRRRGMVWIEDASKRLKTPRSAHTLVNIPRNQIPGC